MVMTGLAWNLKSWWALWLSEKGRWREEHQTQKHEVLRMEFKTFVNAFIKIPVSDCSHGPSVGLPRTELHPAFAGILPVVP